MKKLFGVIILIFVGVVYSEVRELRVESQMTPATSSSNVTISAPGANLRNCLTSVTAISNSTYTFRLLDGGTTRYALLLGADAGLVKDWNRPDLWCAGHNSTLELKVDNGTFSINYDGVVAR